MGIGPTRDEQEEEMSIVEQIRKRHSIWEWREGRLEKLSQCREGHDTRHFYGWLTDIDNLLKEIDSLRPRLEKAERERDKWHDGYNGVCDDLAVSLRQHEDTKAENAALKEKLEEINQWRKNCGDTLTKGDFIFLPSFHFGLLDEILDRKGR